MSWLLTSIDVPTSAPQPKWLEALASPLVDIIAVSAVMMPAAIRTILFIAEAWLV